jgi:hypothetical protein
MVYSSYGQRTNGSWITPKKVGLLFNQTNEKNFWFDDTDYFYKSTVVKSQFFYHLFDWKKVHFELLVQPQYHHIKHQLLNPSFIRPTVPNYMLLRDRFTQLKSINLYAAEFGFSIHKNIFKYLTAEITIGLGFAYIDTETERLAKGFTFIENGSIGFSFKTSKKTSFYLGSNIGHVSNFEFQQPNDGYNVVGYEIGFRYHIK